MVKKSSNNYVMLNSFLFPFVWIMMAMIAEVDQKRNTD